MPQYQIDWPLISAHLKLIAASAQIAAASADQNREIDVRSRVDEIAKSYNTIQDALR